MGDVQATARQSIERVSGGIPGKCTTFRRVVGQVWRNSQVDGLLADQGWAGHVSLLEAKSFSSIRESGA
jgi:hypothetical protein